MAGSEGWRQCDAALARRWQGAILPFRHGYNPKSKLVSLEPDARGVIILEAAELDRIELHLGAKSGYSRVDGTRAPLPVGSALKGGVFYWHLGPGFTSAYALLFERPDGTRIQVEVKVRPKT